MSEPLAGVVDLKLESTLEKLEKEVASELNKSKSELDKSKTD